MKPSAGFVALGFFSSTSWCLLCSWVLTSGSTRFGFAPCWWHSISMGRYSQYPMLCLFSNLQCFHWTVRSDAHISLITLSDRSFSAFVSDVCRAHPSDMLCYDVCFSRSAQWHLPKRYHNMHLYFCSWPSEIWCGCSRYPACGFSWSAIFAEDQGECFRCFLKNLASENVCLVPVLNIQNRSERWHKLTVTIGQSNCWKVMCTWWTLWWILRGFSGLRLTTAKRSAQSTAG